MRRAMPALRAAALHPLTAILALGVALRIAAMAGYRPAYAVFSDTEAYVATAATNGYVSTEPLRPVGYSAFLDVLHAIVASMTFVTVVQHLLGLATVVLIYLTMRRLGGPRWIALAAAAVVALVPDFVFFEHAILSESLFLFLLTGALYAVVRGLDAADDLRGAEWMAWLAVAGVAIAASAMVRSVGQVLVPFIAIAVIAFVSGAPRKRLLAGAAFAVPAAALILAYSAAMSAAGGHFGLSKGAGWAVYSRMAPVADCREFTPPEGTQVLCEETDPALRPGADFYSWHPDSPVRAIAPGPPFEDSKVGSFGRAALLAQPFDYAELVATDMWRYVNPDAGPDRLDNGHPLSFYRFAGETSDVFTEGSPAAYYGPHRFVITDLGRFLGDLQQIVRVHGALLLAALLAALAGAFAARGRARAGIVLLGGSAFALLALPVAIGTYDGRYGFVAYPALVCAGLLGGWALAERLRERVHRRRVGENSESGRRTTAQQATAALDD